MSEATSQSKNKARKPRRRSYLRWVDAPPPPPDTASQCKEGVNESIARRLRARPGEWALVKRSVYSSVATRLRKTYKGPEWEWVTRPAGTGRKGKVRVTKSTTKGINQLYDVYGRYVGTLPKQAENELAEQHEQESAQDSPQSPVEAPQSGDTPRGGTSPTSNGLGAQEPVQSV